MRYVIQVLCFVLASTTASSKEFVKISSDVVGPFEIIPLVWQDSEQFLWLHLGPKGYVRYDGFKFHQVSPRTGDPFSVVHATSAVVDGEEIWISTRDGINRFNTKTLHNTLYKANSQGNTAGASIPDNFVSAALISHDHEKWFISQNSIFKFDEKVQRFLVAHNNSASRDVPFYTGAFDAKGLLWVSRVDQDFVIIDTKSGNKRRVIPGRDIPDELRYVEAMLLTHKGMLVSTSTGLWLIDTDTLQARKLFPEVLRSALTRMTTDKFGNIWVAGTSIYKLNHDLDSIEAYGIGTGQDFVATLFSDYEGNVWAGGSSFGLYKYTATGQTIDIFDPFLAAGIFSQQERIHELVTNRGAIWLASTAGLIKAKPADRSAGVIHVGQLKGQVRVLAKDVLRGWLWAADDRNLAAVDENGRTVFSEDLTKWFSFSDADSRIFSLAVDRNGDLWLSHGRTVAMYHPGSRTIVIEPSFLPKFVRDSGYVQILSSSDGETVVFSAYGYGVFVLDVGSGKISEFTSQSHSIVKEDIWSATVQGDKFFVSFGDGTTVILDANSRDLKKFDSPVSGVACATKTPTQWWLVQLGGFVYRWIDGQPRAERANIDAPADLKMALGTACAVDSAGSLIIATHAGLLIASATKASLQDDALPQTAITAIRVNGQATTNVDAATVELPANADHVEVDVAVMSLTNPTANRFRFRLVGYHDWIESSEEQKSLSYTHLPAGYHQLEIQGRNVSGTWGPVHKIALAKLYYWYWSPWSKLLYVGFVFFALLAIVSFWLSRQRQRMALELAERKSAELAAFAAFRERFFLWMSHDLRTPLTPIALECEAIDELALPKSGKDSIARIRHAARHLQDLVEGLLDVAKLKQGGQITPRLSTVSIIELVNGVLDWVSRESRTQEKCVSLRIEENVPELLVLDERRVRQILGNLITNALRVVPPKGGEVVLAVAYDEGHLLVQVCDNGSGIAPTLLPNLFQDFVQGDQPSKRGGVGLGLAGARHFATSMGGSLVVESTGPFGTIMALRVPAAIGNASAAMRDDSDRSALTLPLHVLVVDDSSVIRDTLISLLARHVNEVSNAASIEDAEQIVGNQSIDVLIVDYELSLDGETGIDLLARLRKKGSKIPAILLTGAPSELTSGVSLAQAILSKPPRKRDLLNAIAQVSSIRLS